MAASEHLKALIVVAKRPAPGVTKTRLSPPLSPQQAAGLYECFLRDTLELISQLPHIQPVLAYLPVSDEAYFRRLAPGFELFPQSGHDLGTRLDNATTHYFHQGYQKVVVMDSDSPSLPVDYLMEAFEALSSGADVSIGPCEDGGYYLIGLKRPAPRLLREVRMSTPWVTADTLALAAEEGLQVHLLPAWFDVDDVASLARLRVELARTPNSLAPHTRRFLSNLSQDTASQPTTVSVIIPALNEAGNIFNLVNEVRSTHIPGADVSVIVVDNGSTDATAEEARHAGAQVVYEPRRGYGYACAAGAAASTADVLVFLDGDYSSSPAELPLVLEPLLSGRADFCLGSRELGEIEPGAMPLQQRLGNRLACQLMNLLYGLSLSDPGPYRAIRRRLLLSLDMHEMTYGWPTEMTVKAARQRARMVEVPVNFHSRRAGRSKVSRTLHGALLAAWYILGVTLRYSWGRQDPGGLPQ